LKNSSHYIVLIFLILPNLLFGNDTIVLKDSKDEFSFTKFDHSVFEDNTGSITIDSILSKKYPFIKKEQHHPRAEKAQTYYWLKVEIYDSSSTQSSWILELFNNKLDHVEFYSVDHNGKIFSKEITGENFPYDQKIIKHKNFVFPLFRSYGNKITIYLRLLSSDKSGFYGRIRRTDYFISYALTEYIYLGLFYGFLLSVLVYNLIIFLYFRTPEYIYYFFYVLSFGIYSTAIDGIGFQYIWFDLPAINNYIGHAGFCGIIIFQILFGRAFNDIPDKPVYLDKIIWTVLSLRIFYFILSVTIFPNLAYYKIVDLISIALLFLIGVVAYKKGYKLAKFYCIGLVIFLGGFLATMLMTYNYIHNIFTVYALNMSILLEIVVFSICLAYRFKDLKLLYDSVEKRMALKNRELKIIERNKEVLERAITSRTKKIRAQKDLLQKKNDDLDTFLYKSSHNLRGPIKSIEGLCNLLLAEPDPEQRKKYIHLIQDSSHQLDHDLLNLRIISELNTKKIQADNFNILTVTEKVLVEENLYGQIKINITGTDQFYTDEILFIDFFRNIINASIKLNSHQDPESILLKYNIQPYEAVLLVTIKDPIAIDSFENELFKPFNINLKFKSKIDFELYRAKLVVEKLNGTLTKENIKNELTFKIILAPIV
jgi:signal transduction histidine kinase